MNKIIKIILTILTPIIQISFFSTQNILTHLNLILCLSALLLFFNSRFLIYFIIITGVILDIYSILPFPFTTMSLLLTIFFLNLLFKNLLTNRSLYSLILLGIIGTIAYNSILSILTYFAYLLRLSEYALSLDKFYFHAFLWQLGLNLTFLIIIWSIKNLFQNRLRHTFFLKMQS